MATNGGANGHQAPKDDRRDTKESKVSDWSTAGAADGTAADAAEAAAVAAHFVQQPWHRRFAAQFVALTWKNLLISWRNWRATILRILSPL